MNLHAARAHAHAGRQQLKFIACRNFSRDERAGNDRAKAFHRESAIDRQARDKVGRTRRNIPRQFDAELRVIRPGRLRVRALTATIGAPSRNDPATSSSASARTSDSSSSSTRSVLVSTTRPCLHIQQPADVKVFARLRHHAFVRRDYQRDRIDSMSAGQHVFHEALVAGNINKANAHVAQIKIRKTKIDSDAASFFFG